MLRYAAPFICSLFSTPVTDGCHSSPSSICMRRLFHTKSWLSPLLSESKLGEGTWFGVKEEGDGVMCIWLDASKELLNEDLLKQNGRGAADTHTSGVWVRSPYLLALGLGFWTFWEPGGLVICIKVCINAYLSCKKPCLPWLEWDLDLHQDVQDIMLSNQGTPSSW